MLDTEEYMKKKGKYDADMGVYDPTDEEFEAYKWCIKNNVHISPFAKDINNWYIDIVINGKKPHRSPDTYKKVEVWKQIYSYYKYYYDKR